MSRRSTAARLAVVRETAAARGLPVSLHQGFADALPFRDAGFDYVLSWNVIHHCTLGDLGRRLGEIWRVLRPTGLLQERCCRPAMRITASATRSLPTLTAWPDEQFAPKRPSFSRLALLIAER